MKLGIAIALFTCSVALAQEAAVPVPQASNPPALRTQSNVVLVPALVRNAKGEVVFTLKAGDFRVTDDGIEQQLTLDEDTGSEPLALVVAVQSGGVGRGKLDSYHNLTAVIEAVVGGVPHRVAVVAFDSAPTLIQNFTPDVDKAGAALNDLDPGDKGAAILDGLAFSVDILRQQPPKYRRAILLISETLDHGSQTHMDAALRAISDTNTTIYSVGFSSGKADAAEWFWAFQPQPQPSAWMHGQGSRSRCDAKQGGAGVRLPGAASSSIGAGEDGGHCHRRQPAAQHAGDRGSTDRRRVFQI